MLDNLKESPIGLLRWYSELLWIPTYKTLIDVLQVMRAEGIDYQKLTPF